MAFVARVQAAPPMKDYLVQEKLRRTQPNARWSAILRPARPRRDLFDRLAPLPRFVTGVAKISCIIQLWLMCLHSRTCLHCRQGTWCVWKFSMTRR